MSKDNGFLGQWHLPLTPIDQINQPDMFYLQVQDLMNVGLAVSWTVAYALFARQALRDKSYGIPLVTMWANFGWDTAFGVTRASVTGLGPISGPWVALQCIIVYSTIKHGSVEWKHNKMISDNLWWALPLSLPISVTFYTLLIDSCPRFQDALFISFVLNQLLTSIGGLLHLFEKRDTRGHSMGIWAWRAVGSFFTFALCEWQVYHYPETFSSVSKPASRFAAIICELVDIAYPFAYYYFDNYAKKAAQARLNGNGIANGRTKGIKL
jgi:paspaline synthase